MIVDSIIYASCKIFVFQKREITIYYYIINIVLYLNCLVLNTLLVLLIYLYYLLYKFMTNIYCEIKMSFIKLFSIDYFY